tara:strand:+ start:274 stop:609 length:336 start_codon:yes stop_codon:yes gene_type:complete
MTLTDDGGRGFDERVSFGGIVSGRRRVGLAVSAALILLSLIRFTTEGSLTTEVWAYLLLTPLPMAIALAPDANVKQIGAGEVEAWEEVEVEVSVASEVPDPIESGFDIPVL